ncbi:hypothetical protein [Actinomyces naeslundii]|uniref:hypothetical protein n=1 Tax=Actinomyces naeslundii TaxID=1655 RepID=UPI0021163F27|nr:hypothetical protein [Actinomyces naeslundii]
MSDHDATQPPASGTPRPGEGDEFNARTVLINQELLDAARSESQPAAGQVPGSAPGAQAQAGSWRPAQPDLPAGPPPEEQTRAYPAGAGRAAAQPATAPADPYLQPNPYAQQGGTDPFGPPSPQSQPGQPAQFGQPDPAGGAGFGGATAPFQAGQPAAQPGGQPTPYSQPAQPAWGAPQADNGAAAAASPFAQSAPGVPSAPGAASDPAAAAASGATTGQETLSWQGPPQASARQPAPHSHPFSGGRHEGDVGMSSVFPTATARAEAEQMAETYAPQGAAQPVAQSAPSSAPSVPSQSSAPQWGSAPSSDAAAGQAPSFSDVVPGAAGAPFGQPAGGGAPAQVPDESADSVGSWMLTMLLAAIPLFGLIYMLVLAFGSGRSASKRNWARATLIWAAIATVLSILLYVVLGPLVLAVQW